MVKLVSTTEDVTEGELGWLKAGLFGMRGVEQHVERFGQLTPDAVLIDVEAREERLVEQPAEERVSDQIRGVTFTGQVKRRGKVGLYRVKRSRRSTEPFLDRGELRGDLFLLASDHVHRDSAAVDRLDQLLSLRGEHSLLCDKVLVLRLCLTAAAVELDAQSLPDYVA